MAEPFPTDAAAVTTGPTIPRETLTGPGLRRQACENEICRLCPTDQQHSTEQMYEGFLQSHQQEQHSQVSTSSSVTGLRSVKPDDDEPPAGEIWIHNLCAVLRKNLPFSMSTNVPIPQAPSSSMQAPDISKDSMREAFQEYHSAFVSPALLVLNVPPFCTKNVIDDNMYYLLKMVDLDRTDVQFVTNHFLTSTSSFIRIAFATEAMAKQFFQYFRLSKKYFWNRNPNSYNADTPIKVETSLAERLERQPLYALVDALTKAPTPSGECLIGEYLRVDYNRL